MAGKVDCNFLLIDERKGRTVVKRRGIPVADIEGVLLAARKHGFVDEVLPIVKSLEEVGYRMSVALTRETAGLAGESRS